MHFREKSVTATILSILDNPAQSALMNKILHKIRIFIVVNPHFSDETPIIYAG